MNLQDTIYIYSLCDPNTTEIKYIGKTNNIKSRYKGHVRFNSKNGYKKNWIDKLKKNNQKPIIEVIDEVSSLEWRFWEKYWISQCKAWGFKLTNLTEGGDGMCGASLELRKKMSESRKGKCFSEEHKKNISKSLKNRIFTDEHRKNIGKKSIGRIFSKERNDKISIANKGRISSKETIEKRVLKVKGIFKHSDESKKRMQEVKLGKKASEETRKKMSIANSKRRHSDETKRKMSESYHKRMDKIKSNEN
jgi:hypothetical protein